MPIDRHANAIAGRLSLRLPQREALEILARVTEIAPPVKDQDVELALQVIQSEYPDVTDFEREFPSLCFALATGVGKTRLMGAFITYLYQARGFRNFFVLAPNLTIYNKLITDFTPNTPKYVFQGIADFAVTPPEIITGDNYESGRGIRGAMLPGFGNTGVHINIFNISKINSEVRGGRSPRIRKLSEYIGQSYFDYLAELDDLVLLMDESHRYRATAGVRAINELRPILGLELTATPITESGRQQVQAFKNVIYSYPLAQAMRDGFVKEPAVATRENFNVAAHSPEELERLKLLDGVRVHEATKVDLEVYAREQDAASVKPFMLVIARDTTHAETLRTAIQDDDFFEGRYRDRVITVHSAQRGEESDAMVQQLLTVERPDNPTEIVIHVNMLKEGWDVTNLYTIVPLRAANARTLVEQSIGRGLRLPYGRRTGVPSVDRLTIVAHDKFQEIVDEAHNPNSILVRGVIIGRDIAVEPRQALTVAPAYLAGITRSDDADGTTPEVFASPAVRSIAEAAVEAIRRLEYLPRSVDLRSSDIQERIVREVKATYMPVQPPLAGLDAAPDVETIVAELIERQIDGTIDIPKIIIQPVGDAAAGFEDFDLDTRGIRYQPVEQAILIQHLQTNIRERLGSANVALEERPENYIVRTLIDYDDISYGAHAALLYKLAGQVVSHLRAYLPDETDALNVLQYYHRPLAALIHAQMQKHFVERAERYEAQVTRGFTTLRPAVFEAPAGEAVRDVRTPIERRQDIPRMIFGGFRRCLYPLQKFSSDPERRFAILLDDTAGVLKWFKPAARQFQIFYRHDDAYEPDFVVETETAKLLCEPKRASDMTDADVLAKAKAATEWCRHATEHANDHGGKPWSYLLIPHDVIDASRTLDALIAEYARR